MKLKSLELRNFRQHTNRTLEFPDAGVVVIQGPNGSGKSGVFSAIQFALMGKTPNKGNKASDITWGLDSGHVKLDFACNNIPGTVKRDLHSAKAALKYDSRMAGTAKEVNERAEELLGCTFSLAEKFIFVRQGFLNELLLATPAERMKLLYRLFKADSFDKKYVALGTEINANLQKLVPVDDVNILKDELSAVKAQVKRTEKELKKLESQLSNVDLYLLRASYNKKVENLMLLTDDEQGYAAVSERISELEAQIEKMDHRLASAYKTRDQCTHELEHLEKSLIAAEAYKLNRDKQLEAKKDRQKFEKELKQLEKKASKQEITQKEAHELLRTLILLEDELDRLNNLMFDLSHGTCPVCGTKDPKGKFYDAVSRLNKRYTKVEANLEKAKEKQSNFDELESAEIDIQLRIRELRRRIEEIDSVEIVEDKDKDSLLNHAEQLKKKINTCLQEISNCELEKVEFSRSLADFKNLLAGYDELFPQLENFDPEQEKAELDKLENASQHKLELAVELKNLRSKQQDLENQIIKVNDIMQTNENREQYRACLERLRSIFHRDGYPAQLARFYLQKINLEWGKILNQLNLDFVCSLDSDLNIVVDFADHPGATADQLSGGQQTCASLGLMLAVNNLFARDTGILLLDEPTYGVDDEHINAIAQVLKNAHTVIKSSDMQLFLITHEERLLQGSDYVITM